MKRILIIAVLAAHFSFFGCASEQKKEDSRPADESSSEMLSGTKVGTKAPDFTLNSTTGKKIKLSDYKNKIVILDFWATWCPPCRKGIPDLIAIQKEFGSDVVVIGLSVDSDTKLDVPGFMQKQGINYPVVYADTGTVKSYGGIEAIPTSIVIDKKGIIADFHVGLVEKEVFVNKINSLLK